MIFQKQHGLLSPMHKALLKYVRFNEEDKNFLDMFELYKCEITSNKAFLNNILSNKN